MKITPLIFEAFLKCATKGHLRSLGEVGSGNEYAVNTTATPSRA
jgi:hypothetical protein